MKKLIAALLCLPAVAFSQVLYMKNNGGGEIVLTVRDCVYDGKKYEVVKHAYAWSPEAGKLDACWTIVDGNVHVLYFVDGTTKVYLLSDFRRRD